VGGVRRISELGLIVIFVGVLNCNETFWHNNTIVKSVPEFFHLLNSPKFVGGSTM
jgi:hypothetical protein